MITETVGSLDDPFPGLRPFQFHENHLFFGRDGLSEELLSRLSETRFLAVVGESGSGKSSLVRAGLLPALCGGLMARAGSDWRVAVLRPGNNPIGELARVLNDASVLGGRIEDDKEAQRTITESTLRRGSLGLIDIVRQAMLPPDENLLIVVDQFEELFRYARNTPKPLSTEQPYRNDSASVPAPRLPTESGPSSNGESLHHAASEKYGNEAAAFVKLLLEAARQDEVSIFVVITMRSDYVGYCAQFWGLPEAINQGQYLIPRLTREQQREAITGPVAVYGGEITPRLVNRLLNDIGDDPDQLPLLQHALMRTWKKAGGDSGGKKLLDLSHYLAVGGMAEALSRHADAAYDELSPGQKKIAEKLFKCLTVKRPEGQESRRPTALKDICEIIVEKEEAVINVIEVFRRRGRSFLMPPASEPLVSKSQIDISHESLIRCWGSLSAWVEDEAESARIYRRLADTAISYRAGRAGLLRDPEAHFTLEWYDKNRPNEVWAQRYHQVDFKVVTDFLEKSREFRNQVLEAEREQLRKKLWRKYKGILAATLSVALAVAIVLVWQLSQQGERINQRRKEARHKSYIASMNLAQYAYDEQNYAEANRRLEEIGRDYGPDNSPEVDRRDNLLGFEWYYLRSVINNSKTVLTTKKETPKRKDGGWRFLPSFLRTEDSNKEDVENEDAETVYPVYSAKFSPDGSTIATGSADGAVKLWDVKTSKAKDPPLRGKSGSIRSMAFSGDGKKMAVWSEDGSIVLWTPGAGEPVTLQDKTSGEKSERPPVYSVAFSHDGKLIAIGDATKLVLRDAEAPYAEAPLPETNNVGATPEYVTVLSLAFSPDDKKLAVGREDGSLEVWDTSTRIKSKEFPYHKMQPKSNDKKAPVRSVDFSYDGRLVAAGLADSNVLLWDLTNDEPLQLPAHRKEVTAVAFYHPRSESTSHNWLATGSNDGSVKLWDTSSDGLKYLKQLEASSWSKGKEQWELATLVGHSGNIHSVDFSPDGSTLVAGSADGTARLWDINNEERKKPNDNNKTDGVSLAFSPDGKALFGGKHSGPLLRWRVEQLLDEIKRGGDPPPNGRQDLTEYRINKNLTGNYEDILSSQQLEGVLSVAIPSRQGNILAVGRWNSSELILWDIPEGRQLPPPPIQPKYQSYSIVSVAFSPDGNTLAAGFSFLSSDGRRSATDAPPFVQIWRRGNGFEEVKPSLPGCDSVAFSPDGKVLAVGCFENEVQLKLLDAGTLKKVGERKIYSYGGVSFAFSPDSKFLAAVGNGSLIELLDVRNPEVFDTRPSIKLKGQKDIVSLAFFPKDNGSRLASGSRDGSVMMWDTSEEARYVRNEARNRDQSGIRIISLQAAAISLAFSPDGTMLVTGSGNGEVKLWRAPQLPERP